MQKNIPYSIAANAKEFLAGIAAEEAANNKEIVKAAATLDSFVKAAELDLREAYDRYIPNVLVVDVLNFTNLIANKITGSDIAKVADVSADSSPIARRFGDSSSEEYKGLYNTILKAVSTYHAKLLSTQPSKNPIKDLNELSSNLFKRTRKINNVIAARVLGFEFSRDVRRIFPQGKAVLAAIEPGLGSSATTFVFFSSSFTGIGKPFRENVYTEIEKYLRDVFAFDYRGDFKTGTLVNLGHAALVNEIGGYVNSPAFAKALYSVAQGESKKFQATQLPEAAAYFKTESKILENKITIDKNFTSTTGGYAVLLSLGVTFTNLEDAAINAQRGASSEKSALLAIGFKKPVALNQSQRKKIADKLMRLVLRNNPLLGKSSRSVIEFMQDALIATLKGNKTPAERSKQDVVSKFVKKAIVQNQAAAPKVFKSPRVSKNRVPHNKVQQGEESLFSLEAYLRARINKKVADNMGGGRETRVLNYRTGRFSESVEINRVSESRAGMISVFYNYMKNPYATFSQGGAQQYPRSRDPKALISESIRQLAAEVAVTRLRSVVV